ncbi:MAG: hypothetical protein JSW51_14500 [Gemmatimonadota bacterium]|nr:MAG: hypothetical protein JSW51_14500 [Gemmatimonadota bacterium]
MLRISDILTGEILKKRPRSSKPPCTPDLPKDPPPVRPPGPWCDTGPDPRIVRKIKKRKKR